MEGSFNQGSGIQQSTGIRRQRKLSSLSAFPASKQNVHTAPQERRRLGDLRAFLIPDERRRLGDLLAFPIIPDERRQLRDLRAFPIIPDERTRIKDLELLPKETYRPQTAPDSTRTTRGFSPPSNQESFFDNKTVILHRSHPDATFSQGQFFLMRRPANRTYTAETVGTKTVENALSNRQVPLFFSHNPHLSGPDAGP